MVDEVKIFEEACSAYMASHGLGSSGLPTLVAVSGGVDSVVLAHLFHKLGRSFAIAHCHFGLRPEAAEETFFVATLAKHYRVPFYTKSFATKDYAYTHKISIQMAARALRYAWFDDLLEQHSLAAVATAHHVSDGVETVMRNLVKGTGITGLCGIRPCYGKVIRPLLFANKERIIAYAKACGLTWREDSSNQALTYERNFIRHKVISSLKILNPNLETTFQTTAERLQQVDTLFQTEVDRLRKVAWRTAAPYHHINMQALVRIPWAGIVLEAWLAPFGFHFKQLKTWLLKAPQAGKKLHSATHFLLANREEWIIGPRHAIEGKQCRDEATSLVIASPVSSDVSWLQQRIYSKDSYSLPQSPYCAALDLHSLSFPLTIRTWQEGDTFYPLTSKQRYRKKVSDFLIDAKVPLYRKKDVKLLVSEGQIVWVLGYQIDDRFKVTRETQDVWEATIIS